MAGVTAAAIACCLVPQSAMAGEEYLQPATYPGKATTFSCRTAPLPIGPGQNINDGNAFAMCPNAQKIGNGPADTSVFNSSAPGYITRFKPSMVEVTSSNSIIGTPSVWDLHLHHVVWLKPPAGTTDQVFASGEEKTEVMFPQGYGIKRNGTDFWALNFMIHNLTAKGGRYVSITWEMDWVPVSEAGTDIKEANVRWMDVAGRPEHIYPVFDAEKGFDQDGDGKWTFPDDVPTDSAEPGYEEREKISTSANWMVPSGGRTLVFTAGHLHPGGTSVDLTVTRNGVTKPLFKSDAHYYEPAGAVSWDVSMEATRSDWRVAVKAGDVVSVSATYDVSKASWYESMGIMPLAVAAAGDPLAKDPFDDAAAVEDMYMDGGILTHGRLLENVDEFAGDDFGLADPRKLKSRGKVTGAGIDIDGFQYQLGGYSAFQGFPSAPMRPPTVKANKPILFTNTEALPGTSNSQQAWHSVTSCKAPCNKGSGIGYPLANGPLKFDSGQLGYGQSLSTEVTTGSNQWTLAGGLPQKGKTYTYFCRIHPFMRGSVRVDKPKKKKGKGKS